ncbi:DeoR family transcriptional regulator [Paenibacillus baekrokdamisoli]|uniref:DeoR family transcriptional regulator n=1 Tax=Paenibacillus baekrokdamisoli TaxID=1712516 RepID=A0A3G9JD27_9BACL|nr:YafY family protein [Paenibacillus baekrokdamisoli]MBB3068103.1 putative DNA-binding transcriptional regulator YafY [Paenibacillus baekrokdamisoli]BBH22853.1 DeoR family transcriptional regulator [Paenibacillus baekrokdamisoli]
MKRIDRLMAILIALQQGSETAQMLASKLEVSKRTILRDMQSLSEMGIPLYAIPGPTGGFRLMEGFQLPPLQLNAQEALTAIFALRAITRITDTPFNQAKWTVMDKIKAVLPEPILKQIEPMLAHVEVEVPERKVRTPHLDVMLAYTSNAQWLQVLYRSENHHRWLELLPQRIYTAHGFWYCEAYSVTHEEGRTFRVDRFEQIEVIAKPEGKLRNLSSDKGGQPKEQTPPDIRILAKLTYRGALLAEQDYHSGEAVKQLSDDEWELDFMCPTSEWAWAIRFFYTLGMDAKVISPESLREEIYQLAEQVRSQYKSIE